MEQYDAIVIGAGAAGGIVAAVLAEAGKKVLLLERGRRLSFKDEPRDHLRNHRLALYGHNTGPELEGNPRVFVHQNGEAETVPPHHWAYQNNAMVVGGGTLVYGGMAWRFMQQDFRMASVYGTPEGSSLADWPISYDELAPYYDRAEWEIGVCGDAEQNKFSPPRTRNYPMPAMAKTVEMGILEAGAKKLGWNTAQVPLLINSVPRNGRDACIQCGQCVGFQCPSNAKNGSQNTMLPRALASGNCTLITQAFTRRVLTDARGQARGVEYQVENDPEIKTASAKQVVVCAGAIESARLLLNSKGDRHPRGLGNEFDNVGRNLQGHYYPGALGVMNEKTYDGVGPGCVISTCQFNHGNAGIIGGAMLANEFVKLPIIYWRNALPPDLPRWGIENKRWMRDEYRHNVHIQGPVHEIPSAECRVTLDENVRDKFGQPVARLSGTTHPETVRTADFMRQRSIEWLNASGARRVWSYPPTLGLSAGQHQAGTCRMGNDAKTSVTDKWGRVHGQDNLFVVDASLHVTNGGFNPVLTIMAMAFRNAEYITRRQ